MRVISGSARGRRLMSLSGGDIVRPTTDRVKEALFSSIQFMLEGGVFLDLFAGSGQMGIEALSRGAYKTYFIDISKESTDIIKKNLEVVGFKDKAAVINCDFKTFLKNTEQRFDIIFLDPPYSKGILQEALPYAAATLKNNGKILCESPYNEDLPDDFNDIILDRIYKYGNIKITSYIKKTVLNNLFPFGR